MSANLDFADLKFRTECNEMVLIREQPYLSLRGPGEIWQTEEGSILFKIFLCDAEYHALNEDLHRPRTAGKIAGAEDLFRLAAQDFTGVIWTSEGIIPGRRGGFVSGSATGRLAYLEKRIPLELDSESSKNAVTVRFRGKLLFPANQNSKETKKVGDRKISESFSINTATAKSDKFSFEIRPEGEHTVFSAIVSKDLEINTVASRIRETLQFVLGREIDPLVVESMGSTGETIKLLSSRISGSKGRIHPPVKIEHFDYKGNFWRLFLDYFCHIILDTSNGWHPISEHVGNTILASSASIGAEILSLSVAIEGITSITCKPDPIADAALLSEIDIILASIKSLPISDRLQNRLTGSIDAMRRPRSSDLLRIFISQNQLNDTLYSSWGKLRNASAHGASMSNQDIEKIVQHRDACLSLLYSIIFHSIGYHGTRIDYSIPGWPTAPWPVAQSKDETEISVENNETPPLATKS